ncbi:MULTISPECIES: hypothetical protein [Actinomadura]|uniref:Uncharacterized protein n=1 Tax=Actinomadura yumaensis TaxID=111807 RepID=A0ABW2CJP8_9ACTN|nr:hypothetical protein [Actinomadura sp. J1-007]MWK37122.1 hypothetical protein [Actinomadura sp. J1-007]
MLEALNGAWDDETGFLGLLRTGESSQAAGDEFLALLRSVNIGEGERLHPDFIRLTWFAPLFVEWQIDRAVDRGVDRKRVALLSDQLRELLMEILGTP